jgi:hypothetical protein
MGHPEVQSRSKAEPPTDNLHQEVVPLFVRDDQVFVKDMELKADLRKLDEHYSELPEDVKKVDSTALPKTRRTALISS